MDFIDVSSFKIVDDYRLHNSYNEALAFNKTLIAKALSQEGKHYIIVAHDEMAMRLVNQFEKRDFDRFKIYGDIKQDPKTKTFYCDVTQVDFSNNQTITGKIGNIAVKENKKTFDITQTLGNVTHSQVFSIGPSHALFRKIHNGKEVTVNIESKRMLYIDYNGRVTHKNLDQKIRMNLEFKKSPEKSISI